MDLASVMSDKALLASLSREYELLKATNASIDWEDWITARLKRAAARRTTSSGGNLAQQQQQPGALARHGNISLRTPSKAQHPAGVSCQGISSSRRSSTADAGQQAPDWKAQDVTNSSHQPHITQAQPPKPSLVRLHDRATSSSTQQQAPAVAQGSTGLLAPPSGPQPHWVAAARLGTALQASKVVGTMHAAADRERRLAAAAAVARQQLDLGLSDAVLACSTSSQQQLQPGAQEQLQQMAKLTQEVVEQNQLLQQAMTQQQAQLSQHQGMLTAVLQQAGGGSALGSSGAAGPAADPGQAAAAAAASAPAAQQQPAACAGAADAACSPDKVRDQIKDSWLVKKLLQQQGADSDGKQGCADRAVSAPDFIRIAGAAKQLPTRSAAEQPQAPLSADAKQQGDADASAQDRRKQLKGVLRQLLTKGAVGQLPDGLAGLLDGLKGLQAGAAAQQVQGGRDSKTGAQSQAASLVALLQQHQAGQRTQLSKAQQLVLQRRKAQEEEERRRQQEQAEQQEASSKPGWQSEVYVAPPSRMLRAKKGAAADVWNAADSGTPGPVSKPAGSKAQPPRRKSAPRSAPGARPKHPAKHNSRSSAGGGGAAPNLASVLYGSQWRVDGGLRQQQQQQQRSITEGGVGTDYSRLARVEEATTQVLEAVARLEQRVQQQQQQVIAPRRSSAAAAEASLQLQEPAALAGLLSALERVERQEKDIRERWFGSSSSACAAEGVSQTAAPKARQAGADCTAAQVDSSGVHPAVEQSTAAADDEAHQQQQQQLALVVHVDQLEQHSGCEQAQEEACALSPGAMQAIKAGRQRFLRHQARLDGSLHELGSAGSDPRHSSSSRTVLQPQQVVEAVADLLLDQLLEQEAQGLDGFCDALCDQLIEGEFLPAA